MKPRLKIVAPTTEKRTVRPGGRQKNATYRTREHLTEAEVDRLLTTAKANRWGHRDATMILVAFRHGFRASELVDLRWDQIDFNAANLHVRRVKKGSSATHPILGDELRALRRLQRDQEPKSPFVFTSERGAPFTRAGFARLVERAGEAAGLGFPAPIHTCSGTLAASPWPMPGTIRGPCRPISATAISSTRSAIPSWRRIGSRTSGADAVSSLGSSSSMSSNLTPLGTPLCGQSGTDLSSAPAKRAVRLLMMDRRASLDDGPPRRFFKGCRTLSLPVH
jgi:type 1 fimbriae regulatory protein FimB/type 1 fimbriae regulatory protein FimE